MDKTIVMDKRAEYENAMMNAMTMKSRFQFQCGQCGICCKTISEVFLTPYDLYGLARHMGLAIRDFIDEFCYFGGADGQMGFIPPLYLKADDGVCVYYKDKCEVYPARPYICRLYPLGYIYNSMENSETYVVKDEAKGNCVGEGRSYKLKEWLKRHDESRAYSWDWFQVHCTVDDMLSKSSRGGDITQKAMRILELLERTYFDYNIGVGFREQYEYHKKALFGYLETIQPPAREGRLHG